MIDIKLTPEETLVLLDALKHYHPIEKSGVDAAIKAGAVEKIHEAVNTYYNSPDD